MSNQEKVRKRDRFRAALDRPWLAYTIAACAGVLLYVLLSHFSALTKFLRSVYNLFSPVVIGLIFAYILNPLVNLFEIVFPCSTQNSTGLEAEVSGVRD